MSPFSRPKAKKTEIETSPFFQRDSTLEAKLAEALGETLRGEVQAFTQVPSTMDLAHQLAAEGKREGTLVFALGQTQGRGRLGRVWESPSGGAYFSLIVRPDRPAADIPQLALIAGLAAVEAIRECAMLSPRVRWPNDVLIGTKKVAGILTEAKNGAVVIGIGINVGTKLSDLLETATSLAEAGGKHLDPFHLTGRLYRRFYRWYDVWTGQGFSLIRDALRPHMALFGEVVRISTDQQQATGDKQQANDLEGQAMDIDEQGRLLVRLDSGIVKAFEMGEVKLLR